jgi:hypothetical protein
VQWQVSTNGGRSFSNIPGATLPTLPITVPTIPTALAALNGTLYQAVFTNTLGGVTLGTVTTSMASLVAQAAHAVAPLIAVAPVNITYGTALKNSQLSGTATVNGQPIAGTFSYGSITTPLAGNGQLVPITWTPSDKVHFTSVKLNVVVNVARATPNVVLKPVTIAYGTALANSQLSGTVTFTVAGKTVTVAGKYSYTSAAGTVLQPGTGQTESVTFTPTDTTDYQSVTLNATVNVTPAAPVFGSLLAAPSTLTHGTPVIVSGKLTVGTRPVPGTVFITLGAVTMQAAINPDGTFAAALPTVNVTAGTQNITFTYQANAQYAAATAKVKLVVH